MNSHELKLTQKTLILEWIKAHGDFVPAKMSNMTFMGQVFPSESKRRCCEVRDAGVLRSRVVNRFVVFELNIPEAKVQQQLFNSLQLAV